MPHAYLPSNIFPPTTLLLDFKVIHSPNKTYIEAPPATSILNCSSGAVTAGSVDKLRGYSAKLRGTGGSPPFQPNDQNSAFIPCVIDTHGQMGKSFSSAMYFLALEYSHRQQYLDDDAAKINAKRLLRGLQEDLSFALQKGLYGVFTKNSVTCSAR